MKIPRKMRVMLAISLAAVTILVLGQVQPAHSQVSCSGVTVPIGFDCTVFVDPAGIGFGSTGVTFDSVGNLYYTTGLNQTIKVVSSAGVLVTTIDRSGIVQAFPWDVIFDGSGILFHSDINADTGSGANDGAVFRDPAGTNTVIAQGFPDNNTIPTGDDAGMAFPSSNNVTAGFSPGLYIANFSPGPTLLGPGGGGSSGIFRISDPAGTPSVSVFLNTSAVVTNPILDAMALAFGPGGAFGDDLYVTDPNLCENGIPPCDSGSFPAINDGAIYSVDSLANVTLFAGGPGGGLEDPGDLAFSSGGTFGTLLYVTDSGTGKVVNIDSSGNITDFATGLTSPGALTFGPDGCLYVSETGSGSNPNRIIRICSAILPVQVDIKPGSFPNSINPRSRGRIPVAILTTGTFDATIVDSTTVLFGRTGTEATPVHAAMEDVDLDGDTDMILHFNTQATGIQCGDTSASLTGETFSGQMIQGSDSIKTVGCK